MPNCMNKFSNTEITILENGLRWIKEAQERFGNKFYHRLMRELPEARLFLHSISPRSFSKDVVQSLDGIIREIRSQGDVMFPLKGFWPELSSPLLAPLEPSELIKVAETFLDLVSELAEDAWSPALEYAWRKAVKTIMEGLWEPVEHSSCISTAKPFQFTKRKDTPMTQHLMPWLGTMMLMAGGIAALGLWRRGHFVEPRLKEREPLRLSICS